MKRWAWAFLVVWLSACSLISPVTGLWEGTYSCAQGVTGLTLTLVELDNGSINGVFNFYPVTQNPSASAGTFTVNATLNDNRLVVRPGNWVQQPSGYVMVGLDGTVSGNSYVGSVDGPGCSNFSLKR